MRDLGASQDKNRLAGITFNYGDECFTFAFDITRRYTTDGSLKPDTTAFVRLVFKNLGQVEARGLGKAGPAGGQRCSGRAGWGAWNWRWRRR